MAEPTDPQLPRPAFARAIKFVGRCAEVPTVLCGLPTIAACGAGLAWPLELMAHFRVQYAVALILLCALLAATRRYRWAVAALAWFAINGWYIAPSLPWSATAGPDLHAGGPTFRLISVNVLSSNPTPDRVLEFLATANADVICIQELTPEWEQRLSALAVT